MSKLKKIFIFCCTLIFLLIVPFSIYAEETLQPLEFEEFDYELLEQISTYSTDESVSYLLEPYTGPQSNSFSGNGYSVVGNGLPVGSAHAANGAMVSNAFDGNDATMQGTYNASPEFMTETVYGIVTFDNPATIQGLYFKAANFSPSVTQSFDIYVDNSSTPSYSSGAISGQGEKTLIFPEPISNVTSIKYQALNFSYDWSGIAEFNLIGEFDIEEVLPPSLDLPIPNEPNYTVDVEQNQIISTNGSPGIRGGQIYSFNIDYFNIYSVVQTAETDEFFSNRNNNYYKYLLQDGKYIFPVYLYSELQVFAPNMNVSGAYIPIEIKYSELIPNYSYIILADDSNVIQRDVSSFSTKYIDSITSEVYSFDNLPFSNSSDNENHLEFLGTTTRGGYTNFNASSVSIELSFNRGVNTTLYFVVTDKYDTYMNGMSLNNQVSIENNMIQNFENVNNSIVSGTSNSQQIESNNNQSNQLLNNTIANYDQLEQLYQNNLDDHLGDLEIDFKFGNITDFTKTANFVRTQFDNITNDNPFGLLIGFSLAVGISLLIIGKRL